MTSFIYALGLFFVSNYIGLFLNNLFVFRHILLSLAICIPFLITREKYRTFIVPSMCVSLCFLGLWNGVRSGFSAQEELQAYYGKNVIVSGRVDPLSWKEKDGFQNFVMKVYEMDANGSKVKYRKKIRVSISEKVKLLDKDVLLVGRLQEQVGFRNPGSIDGKTYNRVQEIGGRLVRTRLLNAKTNDSFLTKLAVLNIDLRNSLDFYMPLTISHLLGGMLFGGSGLEDESREIFADMGLSHLLSVSGTHLILLAAILSIFFKPLPTNVQKVLVFICLVVYALFCGVRAPIMRALLMSSTVIFCGNGAERGRLLGVVGMLMLLFKPEWILDVGFQLSFGASLGLVYFLQKIKSRVELVLPDFIAETVSVTLSVQLVTLPIIIDNFHQISLISLISNVIFLPILELSSFLAILGLVILYAFSVPIILDVSCFFMEQILLQAKVLRSLPFSTVAVASLPLWSYGVYYALIIIWLDKGFIKNIGNDKRSFCLKSLSILLIASFLWSNALPKPFAVYFLDVGQGDCAVVVTPWRKIIVIDTGGLQNYDTGANIIAPFLRSLGKKSIDYLVLSHYDNDHVGGIGGLLRNIKVKTIIMPCERVTQASSSVYEICQASDATKIIAKEGMRFRVDGTHLEIIGVGGTGIKGNEASTVARISYNGRSILFTGDMDVKRESEFHNNPKADVLKVAHHGSKSSSSKEFICRVKPKLAVISVGVRNRYGHPNKEVLATLRNEGIKVLRTDELGCIKLVLSSGDFMMET